jgi:hypothetical protein
MKQKQLHGVNNVFCFEILSFTHPDEHIIVATRFGQVRSLRKLYSENEINQYHVQQWHHAPFISSQKSDKQNPG